MKTVHQPNAWCRLKWSVFRWLMRDLIERYRWDQVLGMYWEEHRRFYTDENVQTAQDSIKNVIDTEADDVFEMMRKLYEENAARRDL